MTSHHTPLRFVFGFAVLWSVLYGFGRIGETSIDRGVIAAITILFLALLLEAGVLATPRRDVPARLGLGRPGVRALVAALFVSLITLAALPVSAHLANEHLKLRTGWPWLAVSLLAYHGFAEELCWRGYTYGRLRCNRSFGAAVAATMPLIAITHVPIVIESGFAVGVAAVGVAAITCVPLAHLYELGRRTIWPCALVHAAIDGFKLIDDPQRYVGLSAVIAGAASVCPFAAFAWSRHPRSRANPSLQPADPLEPGVLITREDQR
jgi:membrane protease YdiL (CAAX protease family)